MPIEEPLQVDFACRDLQQIHRTLDIDFDVQLAQNPAKLGERLHRRPAFFRSHYLHLVANIIIGEFTHRTFFAIDIKHHAPADFHMLGDSRKCVKRVIRMV